MAESKTGMLCFSRAEQRELYLALGLRVSALSQVAAADMSPSQRAITNNRLAECQRLMRLIGDGHAHGVEATGSGVTP
jgi:hypothetical protein